MKRFHVFFRDKAGKQTRMTLWAKDAEAAKHEAERAQFRRQERFPLTFARLEQAKETGEPGMLAIDPRLGGKALTEAWVKGETERRKRDQARYESGFKVTKVEEASN